MAGDAAELGVLGGLVPAIGEYGGAGSGAAGDECVEPVPEVDEVLELSVRRERIPGGERSVAGLSEPSSGPVGD